MKFEGLPGGFGHLDAKNDARLIRLVRETIGEDRDLMIDVQNAWNDVGQAIATCKALAPYNVYFLEAPLPADNLGAYRRLAEAVDIRIAAGDWGFTTSFEFMDLMDRGGVDVVQPSTVRSGGISEIMKIAEMAYRRGLLHSPLLECHGRSGRGRPPCRRLAQYAVHRISSRLSGFTFDFRLACTQPQAGFKR